LETAGASLIAIHARYRASWERTGPGARDGPAMLDQVTEIRKHVRIPILANGNTKTYDDVVHNLHLTQAEGLMSAEGMLDNPALFLPRLGSQEQNGDKPINVLDIMTDSDRTSPPNRTRAESRDSISHDMNKKRKRLLKKLREIERIEEKIRTDGDDTVNHDQKEKLANKLPVLQQLEEIDKANDKNGYQIADNGLPPNETDGISNRAHLPTKVLPLRDLYVAANDMLRLANEYLALVKMYPTKIRTVVFHVRRMLKTMLEEYQLLEDLLVATTVDQVEGILKKCQEYRINPNSFEFDREKASRQKEAMERKRHEEGKRKAFEARMIRKAKREGKTDLNFYLRVGCIVPTIETIAKLKRLSKQEQLELWKKLDHSQHCLSFHVDPGGCQRDRACAFLHVEAKDSNHFEESDEVAG
jgi:tRNA-dihydrouridine synthase 1